jgi:DedD protein
MRLPFFRDKAEAKPNPAATATGGDAAVQAARTAARRRLVGALVLLLGGVIGFPLLFETQPRPLPADLPIIVPEGTQARVPQPAPRVAAPVLPADAGAEPVAAAPAASTPASAPATAAAASKPAAPVAAVKPQPAPAAAPAAAPDKPATTAAAPPPKPAPAAASTPAAATSGRFVVQVGAYNEPERLKAARQRLDKLGFKSYTQEVDTPSGKRTRVRVGPYATRQEAEAAAVKLKAAGLQANVLGL